MNLTHKIILEHLVEGKLIPGDEIAIKIDHTLLQDFTGKIVLRQFEAIGLDTVRTELAVQYVDHNLHQMSHENADLHAFLRSASEKYGLYFSRPGNGISHQICVYSFGFFGKPQQ